MIRCVAGCAMAIYLASAAVCLGADAPSIDFNRDIRPILSNSCFACHGPDENERKGGVEGLRLDTAAGALADLGSGYAAIVPGKPDESELVRRIQSTDDSERMPPADSGKQLTQQEIELLVEWVRQGAKYARHWSYVKPERPELPAVRTADWPRNPIDYFILSRLEKEGLHPSPEADRYAIARRVSLDLTGLPPTLAEVDRFVADSSPEAYERYVGRLLEKETFGEHWARMWLDLARYADSAGYADDPLRTIWAYRDYVIRSFNTNKPFDVFTIEQLAGDLLPNPTEEQLIATAFHRNTLTNSEGGTNDEEFRNVAVVDRVNTTWAVWMGTSMACAQCHSHKYDPISQEEYFRFLAILNNTEDADRRDEAPVLEFYTPDQELRRRRLSEEIQRYEQQLDTITPELLAECEKWESGLPKSIPWLSPRPVSAVSQAGTYMQVRDDGTVFIPERQKTDVYTVTLPLEQDHRLTALQLEALPDPALPGQGPGHGSDGNFVISRVVASLTPPNSGRLAARYVRVEIPGRRKILSLAEVQVYQGDENIAPRGKATQSSTSFDGRAERAIDGKTDGKYDNQSVTHTAQSEDPWWELDLGSTQPIDRVAIWNRTDPLTESRLANFRVALLDEQRQVVWERKVRDVPRPSAELATTGERPIEFSAALAETAQEGFEPASVVANPDVKKKGWAIGSAGGHSHPLVLVLNKPTDVQAGSKLTVTIDQLSQHEFHTLGCFQLSISGDAHVQELSQIPKDILAVLRQPREQRTPQDRRALCRYYAANRAPGLKDVRDQLARARKQLADIKPNTVPIMRELTEDKRRVTRLQYRGNFLDLGDEVTPGLPAAFQLSEPISLGGPGDRLDMAKWLVHPDNPLTARVIANRFWEQIFGMGLVRTSEDFGSQGELPSHPELLDWLATELIRSHWNVKHFLKLLVTSAAYRQSSRVTDELLEQDPDNRLLSRGPRFRMSAEMVRDQALFVSGLLSPKMYGPSVKPPQPQLGLNAAFGSTIDWKTSEGPDRYRRGLYTEWRRSNPYPSMITFDAPNRDVCTIRRNRTNTPLQALVTLNDPVYVECAQALARRIARSSGSPADKLTAGFRICLARPPYDRELRELLEFYESARAEYAQAPEEARKIATQPLGEAPAELNTAGLAAWTAVSNVLLNLDEMLMKR